MVEALRSDRGAFTGYSWAVGVEWSCYPPPQWVELTRYELMLVGEFPDIREYRWVTIPNPRAAWEFLEAASAEMVEQWLEGLPRSREGATSPGAYTAP